MKQPPIKAIIRLALSVLLLFAVFRIVGGERVLEALRTVRIGPWAITLAGFLTLHFLSALKWRFVLGSVGVTLPFALAVRCYGAGLFANLCLPSLVGGDVLRAGLAIKELGSKEAIILGSLVDRFSDVASLGVLVVAAAIAAPGAATELHRGAIDGFVVFVTVLTALLGTGLSAWFVLSRLKLRRLPRKVARFAIELLRALQAARRSPARIVLALLFCVLLQVGFVAVNIFLGTTMGMELDVRLWFLLWPLAKIAAMLPLSLGGIGVREAAFGFLVKPFIDSRLAIAESLAWQSVLIAGGLIAGAYWLAGGARVSALAVEER